MHWLYRMQERLHCTEREAKLLLFLMLTFSLGIALRAMGMDNLPYDDGFYAESDSLFARLSRAPLDDGYGDWVVVGDTTEAEEPDYPIPINQAESQELQHLPGIGPAMAGRILAWRDENGRFEAVDDLLQVRGIGPKTLEKLRDLVMLEDREEDREDDRVDVQDLDSLTAGGRSLSDPDSEGSSRSNPTPPGESMPRD